MLWSLQWFLHENDVRFVGTSSCSCLCYLCLFAYNGIQHILCCVFVFLPLFSSSLPPDVCRTPPCLIYVICVCLCIVVSNTYCVVFLFVFLYSVHLYLQMFVGPPMSYLRYLCLFVYNGIQDMLCCVFVLFFFVLVLCTICCQYLWNVHF